MTECACEADQKVRHITGQKIPRGASHHEISSEAELMLSLYRDIRNDTESGDAGHAGPGDPAQPADESTFTVSDSDIKALDSEFWFRQRFGFALGRRGRLAMFEFIDQYDLTDDEVRKLARAKCISWDGHTLRVTPSKMLLATGSFYLLALGFYVALITLLTFVAGSRLDSAGWATVGAFIIGGIAIMQAVYKFFVEQYLVWRRAKRRSHESPGAD